MTPGGRDNHGCSQKLSQAFIFHHDAEKSLCPNPESPESVQDSSDAAVGLERARSKQVNKSPYGTEQSEVLISEPSLPIDPWSSP